MSVVEELSRYFRESYNIPQDVPVFDRAREITEDEMWDGGMPGCGYWYWVHVTNTPDEWEKELRADLERHKVGFTFPQGYNNIVELVDGFSNGKKMVYMHYRPCAPGLPTDF